jgi:translation initiation factor 1
VFSLRFQLWIFCGSPIKAKVSRVIKPKEMVMNHLLLIAVFRAGSAFRQFSDQPVLQNNNADQEKGQNGPDDDKDPDVDLLIGDAKDSRPVHQHIHTPIENLIHPASCSCIDIQILYTSICQNLARTLKFESAIDILFFLLYTRHILNSKVERTMSKDDHRTVWSSEAGDLRKKKDLTTNPSPERRGASLPPRQQTVYLHRESSGRGGKAVTLVKNLVLAPDDLKTLAKKLKQECGTGGTIKDGVIEMQGEQRQKIAAVLQRLGYKVKVAGG